ncbi:hypothetical protein ACJ41O_011867 [Fusarium nematophilum]
MPGLLDLPDELLMSIAEHVSGQEHVTLFQIALVNKRLNKIVSPSMLLRKWPANWDDYKHPAVERLALHLLRHPGLRTKVKHLRFANQDFYCSHFPEDVEVHGEEFDEVSAQISETWPALADWTHWSDRELAKIPDAFAGLVLSWATDITTLDLQLPYFDPERGDCFLPLLLATQVVQQLKTAGPGQMRTPLPLAQLRHVVFRWWDTEGTVNGKWAAPFFHLPNMRTFVGRQMSMDGVGVNEGGLDPHDELLKHLADFPVGTSSVEEILLNEVDVTVKGLGILVRACRRLKRLTVTENFVVESPEFSTNALAQIILHHKSSLEELCLHLDGWDECDLYEDFEDGLIALESCFEHLGCLTSLSVSIRSIRIADGSFKNFSLGTLPPGLKELSVDLEGILEDDTVDQRSFKLGLLPPSLEALHLSGLGSWANFPQYRTRVARHMDAFQTLVRQCGREGKLPNLRLVSLPVVDHYTVQGIELLKEIAKANRVKLMLCYLQSW